MTMAPPKTKKATLNANRQKRISKLKTVFLQQNKGLLRL